MQSAFGVDHEFSKGLPSALRPIADSKAAQAEKWGKVSRKLGGFGNQKAPIANPTNMNAASQAARIGAHNYGQDAARQIAQGKRAKPTIRSGRELKNISRAIRDTDIPKPNKTVNNKANQKALLRTGKKYGL